MQQKLTPQQAHNSTPEQLTGLGFDLERPIIMTIVDGFYIYTQDNASSEAEGETVCPEEQGQETEQGQEQEPTTGEPLTPPEQAPMEPEQAPTEPEPTVNP